MKLPILAVIVVLATGMVARADLYTGTNGTNLSASAEFTLSGSTLTIVLTNTSQYDVEVPTDVLTAVFFDLPQGVTLTPGTALLTSGSLVYIGSSLETHSYGGNSGDPTIIDTWATAGVPNGPPVGDVGGEWGFNSNPPPNGVGAVGMDVFGPNELFDPTKPLMPPSDPDGIQYGIASAGDKTWTGNADVTGSQLIKNSVTFTLNAPTGFTLGDISNVRFNYGSSLGGFDAHLVPAPAAALLGVIGLGIVGWIKRRSA